MKRNPNVSAPDRDTTLRALTNRARPSEEETHSLTQSEALSSMASHPDQEGPYRLQPLLYPALPDDTAIKPDSPAAVSLAVRCAEGHGNNLYVGSSNGVIHHYVRSDEGSSNNVSHSLMSCSNEHS